jgi:hypothetical protein
MVNESGVNDGGLVKSGEKEVFSTGLWFHILQAVWQALQPMHLSGMNTLAYSITTTLLL